MITRRLKIELLRLIVVTNPPFSLFYATAAYI